MGQLIGSGVGGSVSVVGLVALIVHVIVKYPGGVGVDHQNIRYPLGSLIRAHCCALSNSLATRMLDFFHTAVADFGCNAATELGDGATPSREKPKYTVPMVSIDTTGW